MKYPVLKGHIIMWPPPAQGIPFPANTSLRVLSIITTVKKEEF